METRSGGRRWWLAVLIVAAGALVAAFWIRRPPPPAVASAPPRAGGEAPQPVASAAEPGEDLPEAVQRYLENTVYPPTSGRLEDGHESLLHPNRRYEGRRAIRNTLGRGREHAVSYEFSADRFDVTESDRVVVWLAAERGADPLALDWVEGSVQREGRAGLEGDPVALDFRFDGSRWEALLPLDELADHYGFLVAQARFEYAPGEEHVDTLRFFHTPSDRIPARFTGRFHDYVRDGGLRVEVGLDVEHPGFYRLDANLYDARGEPVAFAIFKGELEAGDRMVPLAVYGKILRDANAPSPYLLRELRGYRFVEAGYPDHETIPASAHAWTTGRYGLAEFTDQAWDSEEKQRMVALMLEDEAAGISIDLPPLADATLAPAGASALPTPAETSAPPASAETPAPRQAAPTPRE